jgi:ethanolamine transporter EutH
MASSTTFAQAVEHTEPTPLVVVGFVGAMIFVLILTRVLRRMLSVVTTLLTAASAAVAGLVTVLTLGTAFTTVVLVMADRG